MNGDWTLDCGPDGTILFGSQLSKYPLAIAPEIGDADRDNQDSKLTGVDGISFGADTVSGQTDAFGLTALGDTDEEARALYDEFRRLWRADTIRSTPGAMATLTAPSGRSTFGRPRRITPSFYPPDRRRSASRPTSPPPTTSGTARKTTSTCRSHRRRAVGSCSGGCAEGAGADIEEEPPGYRAVPADRADEDPTQLGPVWPGVGLVRPRRLGPVLAVVTSITTELIPRRIRGYTSASTAPSSWQLPTWPVITIHGQNPQPGRRGLAGAFTFATKTSSLAYDEWLTINTRPGRRFVTKNGVQSAKLARASTLLPAAVLQPGAPR